MSEAIPNKLFFKIGEVAGIAGIKPHVLRYWENEFGLLRPTKSRSGQRVYRRRDVEIVLEIKRLLYEQRFTIEGARRRLAKGPKKTASQLELQLKEQGVARVIQEVKQELRSLLVLLEDKGVSKRSTRRVKQRV